MKPGPAISLSDGEDDVVAHCFVLDKVTGLIPMIPQKCQECPKVIPNSDISCSHYRPSDTYLISTIPSKSHFSSHNSDILQLILARFQLVYYFAIHDAVDVALSNQLKGISLRPKNDRSFAAKQDKDLVSFSSVARRPAHVALLRDQKSPASKYHIRSMQNVGPPLLRNIRRLSNLKIFRYFEHKVMDRPASKSKNTSLFQETYRSHTRYAVDGVHFICIYIKP